MTDSESPTPASVVIAGRLLEAFVFAPIGTGVKLVEDGPAMIARAKQELSNARFLGEMIVGQGVNRVKARLDEDGFATAPSEDDADSGLSEVEPVSSEEHDEPELESASSSDGYVAETLAIPDYDHVAAIDIVAQLDSLSAAEREAVESYERANRRRRTVLGKLAQLAETA